MPKAKRPPGRLSFARARWAFTWRTVDSELAELVADSATDELALSGVRSDAGPRLLTFEVSQLELAVEVQVTESAGARRLLGQVVPPQQAVWVPADTLHAVSTDRRLHMRSLYLDLRDEFGEVDAYVDLHHMGPCEQIEGDGDYVSVTLDYPPLGPEDSDKYDGWPLLDQDKSRRFAYAAYLGMRDHAGNGNADQSPFLGGIARYIHFAARDPPGSQRSDRSRSAGARRPM